MQRVYLVKISNERSIAIYPFSEESIVNDKGEIKYRNLGEKFEDKILLINNCKITDREILILNANGAIDIHFPIAMLNTEMNMLNYVLNIFKEEIIDVVVDVFGIDVVQNRIDNHKKLK